MYRCLIFAVSAVIWTLSPSTTCAYELYDPPWSSGEPGWEGGDATYAAYDFNLGSEEVVIGNDFGDPEMTVTDGYYMEDDVVGPDGESVISAWWINPDGAMTFKIPNSELPRARKVVLLQFTSSYPSDIPISDPEGTFLPNSFFDLMHEGDWVTRVDYFEIRPNPSEETFTYRFSGRGAYVSEFTVSTICIPEPSSLVLTFAVLATLATWRRTTAV